jgi:sortase A
LARHRAVEDLSVDELRRLLMEKQRSRRQDRLERYRKTGRVIGIDTLPVEIPGSAGASDPELDYGGTGKRKGRRKNSLIERVLLAVEVLAVLGLIVVLLNGMNLLRSLNQEVASALQQSTLTPTPLIMAVVLPSGHTPPNSAGGAQPNLAEIPEHLRPMVQSMADLPLPTPSAEQAVRIQVPAINVDAPVVQGDGWEQLKKGVGQHLGTPNPGKKGNLVLSAHNDVFGEIFRELDRLKAGDKIIVFTTSRTYTYTIRQVQTVQPTQVEVMAPSEDVELSLISCYPYMVDNQRIVVTAIYQE